MARGDRVTEEARFDVGALTRGEHRLDVRVSDAPSAISIDVVERGASGVALSAT